MSLRSAFIESLSFHIGNDRVTTLLLGDISVFAFKSIHERFPERVVNVGCTEQASVAFAAGLSIAGLYPVYHTIDTFMVRRAYEFIRLDFGEQALPGLFISVGGTNDYSNLGPTHMGCDSIALMSQIPGLTIVQPNSEKQVYCNIDKAISARSLCYIRLEEG